MDFDEFLFDIFGFCVISFLPTLFILLIIKAVMPPKYKKRKRYYYSQPKYSNRYNYRLQNKNVQTNLIKIGTAFEEEIFDILEEYRFSDIYHNVYVSSYNEKVQIDIIVLTARAIHIVECKKWDGMLIGNSKWNRLLYCRKFRPYGVFPSSVDVNIKCIEVGNPLFQVSNQHRILSQCLKVHHFNVPIFQIVVFDSQNTYKYLENKPSNIIHKESLPKFIREIEISLPPLDIKTQQDIKAMLNAFQR